MLTIDNILTIIRGIGQTLKLLQSQPEYTALEARQEFRWSNDFDLEDVINALGEVEEAIETVQSAQPDNNGA